MKCTLKLGGIYILKKPLFTSYENKFILWSMIHVTILPLSTIYLIYALIYLSINYWLKILMITAILEGIYMILHFLVYFKSPLFEIYEDGISKQKYFLSPNSFLKRKKFINFSTIKSIELRRVEDFWHSTKILYLFLLLHNNGHVKIELINDSIISDVKKILKENFKNFHDLSDESKN